MWGVQLPTYRVSFIYDCRAPSLALQWICNSQHASYLNTGNYNYQNVVHRSLGLTELCIMEGRVTLVVHWTARCTLLSLTLYPLWSALHTSKQSMHLATYKLANCTGFARTVLIVLLIVRGSMCLDLCPRSTLWASLSLLHMHAFSVTAYMPVTLMTANHCGPGPPCTLPRTQCQSNLYSWRV